MQTYFKRIDRSKDDFSKMLFFTSTKDGHLLESNIFEEKGSQRLLSVSLWTARVLMVVASTHKFKERGVTTVVHCSSGHDHVTYTFFFLRSRNSGISSFIHLYLYIYIFVFIRLLSRSGNGGISSSVDLYCVYIPPKNEYICCHLPICTPNNVPEV